MAKETILAIVHYQADSRQNPPYHTDAPFQRTYSRPVLAVPTQKEIQFDKRCKLNWKIWDAKRKHKPYDTIQDPFEN